MIHNNIFKILFPDCNRSCHLSLLSCRIRAPMVIRFFHIAPAVSYPPSLFSPPYNSVYKASNAKPLVSSIKYFAIHCFFCQFQIFTNRKMENSGKKPKERQPDTYFAAQQRRAEQSPHKPPSEIFIFQIIFIVAKSIFFVTVQQIHKAGFYNVSPYQQMLFLFFCQDMVVP